MVNIFTQDFFDNLANSGQSQLSDNERFDQQEADIRQIFEEADRAAQNVKEKDDEESKSFLTSVLDGLKGFSGGVVEVVDGLKPVIKDVAEIAPDIVGLIQTFSDPEKASLETKKTAQVQQQLQLAQFALQQQNIQNQQALNNLKLAETKLKEELDRRNQNKLLIGIGAGGIVLGTVLLLTRR